MSDVEHRYRRVAGPEPSDRVGRRWIAAGLCAAAAIVLFQFFGNATHGYINTNSLFWWWTFQWINPTSETEHGWLILALSAWLVWKNLKSADCGSRIADGPNRTAEQPSAASGASAAAGPGDFIPRSAFRNPQSVTAAFVALTAGLALHLVGFVAQQSRISIVALLVFTWGVLRLGGGKRWGDAAAFPLAFLVFAIPINVLDSAGFWLRMWVIDASTAIAHLCRIGVIQSGTQLLAPDGRYNYDVAAACSGVRSLMALAALSLLIGYLFFRAWWKRAALLLLCFPLVYLGNVARIVSIIFAAQWGGPKWGDFAHAVMGYGIFLIVLGGVLAAAKAFERWLPDEVGAAVPSRPEFAGASPLPATSDQISEFDSATSTQRGRLGTAAPTGYSAIIAAVIVVLAIGEMFFLRQLAHLPPRVETGVFLAAGGRNPVELPGFLGSGWVGWPAQVSAVEREILPPDTGFSRMEYVSSRSPHNVLLSIVLSGRDRTSIHRPELCLVGQGWTMTARETHTFTYPGQPGAAFPATVLRIERRGVQTRSGNGVPQLAAYWFVNGDRVVATHAERFFIDAWNRIAHGRADRWAYVLMITDATDGEPRALARMQAVLDATLPTFQRPMGIPALP
jgi:exosortase